MNASSALCAIISGVFFFGVAPCTTQASIIEVGDLNIIDDTGNSSDGLRYLDMTFSSGLSSAAAITNAQLSYPNARLATPSEFDDLFTAAGIISDGAISASDGFLPGINSTFSSLGNYDGGALASILGYTFSLASTTEIWTDPDANATSGSTRDLLLLNNNIARLTQELDVPPTSSPDIGWLLVSEAAAVPEASEALVVLLGMTGLLGARRRRR